MGHIPPLPYIILSRLYHDHHDVCLPDAPSEGRAPIDAGRRVLESSMVPVEQDKLHTESCYSRINPSGRCGPEGGTGEIHRRSPAHMTR